MRPGVGGRALGPSGVAFLLGALALPMASRGDAGPVAGSGSFRAVLDAELVPLRRGQLPLGSPPAVPLSATRDGEPLRLRLTAFPVLPGREVGLAVVGESSGTLTYQTGTVRADGPGGWLWRAPETPGAYALRLTVDDRVLDLTALVLHPAARVQGGSLQGYPIGEYRSTPLRGSPAYLPPEGFVEVGAQEEDILVSPRLTLGQFTCKQPGNPRFVVLSVPLLHKLEVVLDRLGREGHRPEALVVMSGFRTPAYNRAIGNATVYSRHLWGDAADIYLDADRDGEMDDLSGDGRVDVKDARILAALVEKAAGVPGVLPGGLAVYRRNAVRGPFVHLDARGTRARW